MRIAVDRSCSSVVISAFFALFAFVARAQASTIVVDSQGSGQFTDIPPAIAAAQPGDILLVRSGVYSGFTLDKGLRIIGYGGATCGAVQIAGVPAGYPAALVQFDLPSISISSCHGPVLLDELTGLQSMNVAASRDVRVHDSPVQPPDGLPNSTTLAVSGSRLELVESQVGGSNGVDCISHQNGGQACQLSSSRVHISRSNVDGGSGSSCYTDPTFFGGDGQAGIGVTGGQLILFGGGTSFVSGGGGGLNFHYDVCTHDGDGSCGIAIDSAASMWYSGVSIGSGVIICNGSNCVYCPLPPICGDGPGTHAASDGPTLSVTGNPARGQTITFTLRGSAGSSAILYFGRQAIVVADTDPAIVEQLTPMARVVDLGTIPASGEVRFAWPIAVGVQPGTLLVAQSEVMVSSNRTQRTNSVPVIVR